MSTWIYKQTEGPSAASAGLWTVGHYWNDGTRDIWDPSSDHNSPEEAAQRVRFLNGGGPVGVCGARNTMLSNWDGTPVTFVCTRKPDHKEIPGEDEHEDGLRLASPHARWRDPEPEPQATTAEEARTPQHFGKEAIVARLRTSTEPFTVELAEGDTAFDVESGDTLIGPARITYSYGVFPGTTYRATVLSDDDGDEGEVYDKVEDLVSNTVADDQDAMESMYPRDREDGEGIHLPSYGE